ncbi:MAG: 5-(carboxyamino)imidazole ribonucleotide mutase [Candidatus Ancillula sp.]|jgi:5-(carboxyamino)imidazole ribonucleotide mutase|nr:5-(carboxyamino)imidazole ribonucleotide mutase [Candidatus Ancillula sp.]
MIEFRSSKNIDPVVAVVMGSDSDWKIMKEAGTILELFDIPYFASVVSAHRMPTEMMSFAKNASRNGIKVIVAGAGGAAHLPGMIAACTTLPVIGVPVALKNLQGLDSLLSIVQMPAGIPVATVSVDGAKNAGLLAVRILGIDNLALANQLAQYAKDLNALAIEKGENLV